jgi:lipopolysaccharide biosynthesis glycosyltransferase
MFRWVIFLLTLHEINSSAPSALISPSPLHVVYVLDSYSYQYFILSITSIAQKHPHPPSSSLQIPTPPIHIHSIIATSSSQEYSDLQQNISRYFSCYPFLSHTSYQYLHPEHYTNLMKRHEASNGAGSGGSGSSSGQTPAHWLSMTEKLRNYIPEILPNLNRYIYLDNDVIITKRNILYHLWQYNLEKTNSPVGVVANQLHSVEFDLITKIYDLNHPFIQQTFHLIPNSTHPKIETKDLKDLLPYYPNNGVMLVNATRWKELDICSKARSRPFPLTRLTSPLLLSSLPLSLPPSLPEALKSIITKQDSVIN